MRPKTFPATLRVGICALAALATSRCASLAERGEPKLEVSADAEADFPKVPAEPKHGLVAYKGGAAGAKVEWLGCRSKSPQATVLVMHGDQAGFDAARFCGGWIAQAFLASGYDVLAVNRPGFGGSPGTPDFSGELSLTAVKAAVADAATAAGMPKPVTGLWGYGSGATAAALAARQLPGLKFLILGGGIYDYDETAKVSADAEIKRDIAKIKALGGEKAIEQRSVGYDVGGLPKQIAIYHGVADTAVPAAQAKAFADSLESSGGYRVNLQLIDGVGHDIPWIHHRRLVEALAHAALATGS